MNAIPLELPEDLKTFVQNQTAKGGFKDESEYLITLIETEQKLNTLPWPNKLDERLDRIESNQVHFTEWAVLRHNLDPHQT